MKHIAQIMAASLALLAAGCATGGLPRGAQVVGGGLLISWHSTKPGTAILVETTTHKTVMTESINGSYFNFDAAREHDADILRAVLGFMPTNAQFVLYFVPSHE